MKKLFPTLLFAFWTTSAFSQDWKGRFRTIEGLEESWVQYVKTF